MADIYILFLLSCASKQASSNPKPESAERQEVVIPTAAAPEKMVAEAEKRVENKVVEEERGEQEKTFDFPAEMVITEITDTMIQNDPSVILYTSSPPFDQRETILAWLDLNVKVYFYLPEELRNDRAIQVRAIQNGIPMGIELTEAFTARVQPDMNAAEARGASYVSNGNLMSGRSRLEYAKGSLHTVLKSNKLDGETWYQVLKESKSNREDEKEMFEMLDNHGVSFEDFGFSVDAAWIPASLTKNAIYAEQSMSGIYTFNDVQNGDLAVYVLFDEISFAGFEEEYAFFDAVLEGKLKSGDKVRVIWRKAANSPEKYDLIWAPEF